MTIPITGLGDHRVATLLFPLLKTHRRWSKSPRLTRRQHRNNVAGCFLHPPAPGEAWLDLSILQEIDAFLGKGDKTVVCYWIPGFSTDWECINNLQFDHATHRKDGHLHTPTIFQVLILTTVIKQPTMPPEVPHQPGMLWLRSTPYSVAIVVPDDIVGRSSPNPMLQYPARKMLSKVYGVQQEGGL